MTDDLQLSFPLRFTQNNRFLVSVVVLGLFLFGLGIFPKGNPATQTDAYISYAMHSLLFATSALCVVYPLMILARNKPIYEATRFRMTYCHPLTNKSKSISWRQVDKIDYFSRVIKHATHYYLEIHGEGNVISMHLNHIQVNDLKVTPDEVNTLITQIQEGNPPVLSIYQTSASN